MRNLLKRFKKNDDGNISAMFAVSFTASLFTIGSAIDLALIHKNEEKLQSLADAAALAALQYDGELSEKEAVFTEYINTTAEFSGDVKNIITSQIKIEETEGLISLDATVSIPFQLIFLNNFYNFDIIQASTTASVGIEDIEVALAIDISSSMSGARIREAKKSATFFIDELLNDESTNRRVAISFVPFGGTVRVPEEMQYLLETPEEGITSYSKNWIDRKWNQCFEFEALEVKKGIDLDGVYPPIPDFYSFNPSNPWCPREGNEMVPLTDDSKVLAQKINSLTLSDGTGSDHGMLWAYETLNDKWLNKLPDGLKDTPAKNNSTTKKILIFMTDGGITAQHYLRDQYKRGNPPFNSRRKVRVSRRDSRSAFHSLCDSAKSKDIEIFTIGYNLSNTKHKTDLETCAASPTHYLDARTGNLESVFANIASSISPLRLSN